jgi:phenylacetate-CoA ligase
MNSIIELWVRENPLWMFATPMIYTNYAKYINELRLKPFNKGNLSFIEYTSQDITPDQEELLSSVYNCKLINNFGSREFWNIAYECPHGKLHLNDEYLLVDVIDEYGNIINTYGKTGDIIITDFINRDMPFTKYYLGDKAKIIKNNCNCGCKSDILELELQNDGDIIKNTGLSGSRIFRRVMRGIYFHDNISDIKRIKVVQESEKEFLVYLEKEKISDTYFEERFLNRANLITPDFSSYKVSFLYSFPFESTDYRFKEVIFNSNT